MIDKNRETREALWVPETVHTARDLAVVRGRWQA
jgi:hypothetical protein